MSVDDGRMSADIALMSVDGVTLRDLAWAGDIPWIEVLDPGSLSWAPDGRGIAYTFVDNVGNRSVKYVSIDGSRNVTLVAQAHSPSWTR